MWRSRLASCFSVASVLLLSACAEPPNKEMDRAQGAIDAARAAGAEQYASAEYSAATTALKNANDAVLAGDYRLALNYALDSHEHAQNAARDTANTKARMRADVERSLTEIEALLTQLQTRIGAVERARVPRRSLAGPAEDAAAAQADLQKAREVVAAGDYVAATKTIEEIRAKLGEALAAISATAQSSRSRP